MSANASDFIDLTEPDDSSNKISSSPPPLPARDGTPPSSCSQTTKDISCGFLTQPIAPAYTATANPGGSSPPRSARSPALESALAQDTPPCARPTFDAYAEIKSLQHRVETLEQRQKKRARLEDHRENEYLLNDLLPVGSSKRRHVRPKKLKYLDVLDDIEHIILDACTVQPRVGRALDLLDKLRDAGLENLE